MHGYNPRYDAALQCAARAHRNQLRKGSDVPYIAHVVHVAAIIERHGFADDIVIAGLLHDVVEDTELPLAALAAEFGAHVARLVEAVSEQKMANGQPLPWDERKKVKLAHLRAGGPDVAALKAADAIHNVCSIAADVARVGPRVWQRFKATPQQTVWYYAEILAGVQAWLPDHPITTELAAAVRAITLLVQTDATSGERQPV